MSTDSHFTPKQNTVSDWIQFWKLRHRRTLLPQVIQLRQYPYIYKVDGNTNISFRRFQKHLCPTQFPCTFRQFQQYHKLHNTNAIFSTPRLQDTIVNMNRVNLEHQNPPSKRQKRKNRVSLHLLNKLSKTVHKNNVHIVWKEVVSREGLVYYWNTETDDTQYERPLIYTHTK